MYTYIVIGAGSSGCVVANRLSANPNHRVLLLEAGERDWHPKIHIPAAYGSGLFKSAVDWNYETEPQANLNKRRLYWPRGKVLGGSSSINAMIYIRGNRRDFDTWRELGNEGWGYDDLLPTFKKSENQERGADAWHGVGGLLNVADLIEPNPLSRAFIEAATLNGIAPNGDFNAEQQEGVGFFQVMQKNGRRHSSAVAFLNPARQRPNLTILTGAHVTRLLIEGRCASGVDYVRGGKKYTARAEGEIILCGGAVNSPQLLMLSGIGAAAHLRQHGIPVQADLPGVGENLHDHIAAGVFSYCTQPISLAGALTPRQVLNYLLFRKGMLTSNVGEAGAFVHSRPSLPVPDIEYHFGPVHYVNHGLTKMDGHGFTIGPVLVYVESRGNITLRSADPFAKPAIQPNYLQSQNDFNALVYGIKQARDIIHAHPFDAYRGKEILPGEAIKDDRELREYVRSYAETLYHPVGTCKMGIDPLAVVNPQLQVYGITNLRVADASIMPIVTAGNTNAACVLIGEKVSEFILQDTVD